VLVHEATHLKHQKEAAEFYGHSTPTMAVRFAKAVNARLLILSHISQRVVSRPGVGGRGLNKVTISFKKLNNKPNEQTNKITKQTFFFISAHGLAPGQMILGYVFSNKIDA
jgi:Metal-dependent hydrolases of the beta-lactamase superfamily III